MSSLIAIAGAFAVGYVAAPEVLPALRHPAVTLMESHRRQEDFAEELREKDCPSIHESAPWHSPLAGRFAIGGGIQQPDHISDHSHGDARIARRSINSCANLED